MFTLDKLTEPFFPLGTKLYLLTRLRKSRSNMTSKSTTQPRITIYRGWEDPGKYVWSPFVTKLELRLRYGGLSYETKAGSTFKAPKGKVPYIDIAEKDLKGGDSESSTSLADSTLIIQALMENGLLEDINASLSPMDRAHDLSLRALLEDKLYFYHVCSILLGR